MKQKIIDLLYNNARLSIEDMATMLGTDIAEVSGVMDELEKDGVICGYKAVIDWEKINNSNLTALIELKVSPQKDAGYDSIADKIIAFDEVESLYLMSSGMFDFTVIVRGESFQEVAKFVSNCLAPMENVVSTATHFILRRYKELNVELNNPSKKDDRGTLSF